MSFKYLHDFPPLNCMAIIALFCILTANVYRPHGPYTLKGGSWRPVPVVIDFKPLLHNMKTFPSFRITEYLLEDFG